MAVTLVEDQQLSRIRITADSLGAAATHAVVDRSVAGGAFELVRGGGDVQVTSQSLAHPVDDYEFADRELATYRVRSFTVDDIAVDGLQLPGSSGDYASTPDDATLDITGDITLAGLILPDDTTPTGDYGIVGKWVLTGDQRSYLLLLATTGTLEFHWSTDGTAANADSVASSQSIPASLTAPLAVRVRVDVDNGASDADIVFETSDSLDGPWTQLGTTQNAGSTISLHSGTAGVEVGSWDGGTNGLFTGMIQAALIASGAATSGNTVVAEIDFTAQTTGDTSFTGGEGLTWTVNGGASIVSPQTATITPTLDAVWIKSIVRPFLNRTVTLSDYSDVERSGRTGVFPIVGRTFPVAVTDVHGARGYELILAAATHTERHELVLLLTSGDIVLLHVPDTGHPTRPETMYAAVEFTRTRRAGHSQRRSVVTRLAEVAASDPVVVGATVTWQGVVNEYSTWADLVADQPTWADVLEFVGAPADVIVQ